MDLHHEFTVPLDVDAAWVAFNDLERIGPAFPGAEVTSVDGDDFTGTARVKLGPVSLQYHGSGRFVSRDEAARQAVIEASGKDRRGNGTAAATITARVEPVDAGTTRVVLDTDLRITGRPAQFGRGVISDIGGKILDQFAANLRDLLGSAADVAAHPGAAATSPAATSPAATSPAATSPAATSPAAAGSPFPPDSPAPASPAPAALPPAPPAPAAPPPPGTAAAPAPAAERRELDLGAVLGTAVLGRHRTTIVACVVTAVLTWRLARRLP